MRKTTIKVMARARQEREDGRMAANGAMALLGLAQPFHLHRLCYGFAVLLLVIMNLTVGQWNMQCED